MKLRMDALHYALLAVVVLLILYCGTRFVKEGAVGLTPGQHIWTRQGQRPLYF